MAKPKKKKSHAQKEAKKQRQRKYMTIFVNGKQKRVKRPPTIDGIPQDEFIRNNADPIWLLQEGMYEELYQWELDQNEDAKKSSPGLEECTENLDDTDLPF